MQAANDRLAAGEQGDDAERLGLVGHGREIDFDSIETFTAGDGDRFICNIDICPHPAQHVRKAHIALQASFAQSLDRDGRPG